MRSEMILSDMKKRDSGMRRVPSGLVVRLPAARAAATAAGEQHERSVASLMPAEVRSASMTVSRASWSLSSTSEFTTELKSPDSAADIYA